MDGLFVRTRWVQNGICRCPPHLLLSRVCQGTHLEPSVKSKRDLDHTEWPEEKLLKAGVARLSDVELLATFIGSGIKGANAKQIATDLLRRYGPRLLTVKAEELARIKGIGKVKAARLNATLELACRLMLVHSGQDVAAAVARVAESSGQLSLADLLHPHAHQECGNRNRTFMEFFAGIGLVRYALQRQGWAVVYANDIDEAKCSMYADHFGHDAHLDCRDIHKIDSRTLPDAVLATASFPCTDLSLAGGRKGLSGEQSSAFWGFVHAMEQMGDRRPPIVMLENVPGFLSSNGGKDLRDALVALNNLGYGVDLFAVDATHFVPQSRRRLFIVGTGRHIEDERTTEEVLGFSDPEVRSAALATFIRANPSIHWQLRILPSLPNRVTSLKDIVEDIPEHSNLWWPQARAKYLLSQMSPSHRTRMASMIAGQKWSCGTVFRRVRHGRCMAELRTDGTAGCLRTPKGGSAKQILVQAGFDTYRVRLLTPRECARLMGAHDLTLKATNDQALFGLGDAVCVPVIEWIATHYLNPIADRLPEPIYAAIA
jgi:DNA (cytosine-5)-methyltransferase 1